MRECSDVEVGVELAVQHAQDIAVELGGDAGRVVVRGNEPIDVLHEVGAEQERVAGRKTARHLGEELGAFLGREVADRAAEERDDAASAGGDLVEMVLEVADDRVHFDAVVLAGDRGRCAPECLLADVERNEATQRARARERVEQQPRLLRRARAELDERVGAGLRGDRAGAFREDAPLRPRVG